MPLYTCEKCGKSFPHPSKLKRHNERKTPCNTVSKKRTSENLSEPLRTSENLSEPLRENLNINSGVLCSKVNHTLKQVNITTPFQNFTCEYCNIIISRKSNYKRHLRETCELIPLSNKKILQEKYNKNKKHLNNLSNKNNQLIKNDNNNKIINNNNTLNNTTNNNNNTLNINNNNYTININPLGKEDISKIGDDKIIKYLCEGTKGFTKFLSSIYSINENKNVYIKNKKENIIQYINKDYQIDIGNLDEIISDLTLIHHNTFEDLFEIHQDKLSKVNQNKYERASKSYNNNPERFERKTYLCLININNINKNYINKFLKIKNEKGEEQVLIGKL